ncbi:hypothetical protein DFJ67_6962 [Asanoa ferruginea]|uniref:Secreted protein n=1 Tax=Asanoa ferruginea TaxID=53367 RepID=A0A3D9ZWG9_9ACTN|nr:hypothetical protein DFJ67_6962 [Asanoa ferruginea]GIF47484.1 hypothetical protein Afe04nite_20230 [Asanoa ferruginea]
MTIRKRIAALTMTAVVALGSVFVVASPASAAPPTCTSSPVNDNAYFFSCYNSTVGGVWLQITCANFVTNRNRTVRYEHRPIGWPWSLGKTLYCSNLEYADSPHWGAL